MSYLGVSYLLQGVVSTSAGRRLLCEGTAEYEGTSSSYLPSSTDHLRTFAGPIVTAQQPSELRSHRLVFAKASVKWQRV